MTWLGSGRWLRVVMWALRIPAFVPPEYGRIPTFREAWMGELTPMRTTMKVGIRRLLYWTCVKKREITCVQLVGYGIFSCVIGLLAGDKILGVSGVLSVTALVLFVLAIQRGPR